MLGSRALPSVRVVGTCEIRRFCARPLACEELLSRRALLRKPSPIRALQPLTQEPGMISLGGGMPNPKAFPFKSMTFGTADEESIHVPAQLLADALQYSATPGLPELNDRLRVLMEHEHKPHVPFSLSIGPGSQYLLSTAFDTVLNDGDTVLVENPTYPGALACLDALDVKYTCIPTDGGGLIPAGLRDILVNWNASEGPRPRVLYTIPTGANPSGATLNEERRDELYAVSRDFDLLILEDDPYHFLQFGARSRSLFSRDVDGRVIRFDSFSKILSAGIRVGCASGPPRLLEAMNFASQASILFPSGVSQALMLQLFRQWGIGDASASDPFGRLTNQIDEVCKFYYSQLKAFEAAFDKHDLAGLGVSWTTPTAGMFAWMHIEGVADTHTLIMEEARAAKFLMVPGTAFIPGNPPSPHVRAAFSTATPEQMDLALGRFAKLLQTRKAASA